MSILYDTHMHSSFSTDSDAPAKVMVRQALDLLEKHSIGVDQCVGSRTVLCIRSGISYRLRPGVRDAETSCITVL